MTALFKRCRAALAGRIGTIAAAGSLLAFLQIGCVDRGTLDKKDGASSLCNQCAESLASRRAVIKYEGDDLVGVDVSQSKLNDTDLACLARCKKIRVLLLSAPTIEGPCLEYFGGTDTVEELYMESCGLRRREALRYIGGMKHLKQLAVCGAIVDDSCLGFLQPLHELVNLQLSYTSVSDGGAKEIAKLKRLRYLYLTETLVGDEGVRLLSELPNIEDLSLAKTQITDGATQYLARMNRLKGLSLLETQISGPGLADVARLPELKVLDLRKTRVSTKIRDDLRRLNPRLTIYGPELN